MVGLPLPNGSAHVLRHGDLICRDGQEVCIATEQEYLCFHAIEIINQLRSLFIYQDLLRNSLIMIIIIMIMLIPHLSPLPESSMS